MRLEHYPPKKLKKEIGSIVGRHLDTDKYKVFLFGSRVSGKGDERSDIDVGIEGPGEIPYEIMSRIKEDIEGLSTLYKVEVVDFKKVSDDFRKVAMSDVEYLLRE